MSQAKAESRQRLDDLDYARRVLGDLNRTVIQAVSSYTRFLNALNKRRDLEIDISEGKTVHVASRDVNHYLKAVQPTDVLGLIGELAELTARLNDFEDSPLNILSLRTGLGPPRSPQSTETPYEYVPLRKEDIRILELLPGPETALITCIIRHVSIINFDANKPPNFEALSYTWGTDSSNCPIRVNGKRFFVTPNLEEALKELRNGEKRRLWIDAICINQADVQERNQQVLLMRSIYSISNRVVIWLGPGTSESDRAMDFLTTFQDKDKEGFTTAQNWLATLVASQSYEETYKALASILTRPWFYRVWIIQEFAFSTRRDSDAIFMCGAKQVFSETMNRLSYYYEILLKRPQIQSLEYVRQMPIFEKFLRAQSQLNALFLIKHSVYWKSLFERLSSDTLTKLDSRESDLFAVRRAGLHHWMETARKSLATDPRDKVYAILGIVDKLKEEETSPGYDPRYLKIDYSSTVENVYASAVKSVIAASGKLEILTLCSERSSLVTRTWVPDWTKPGRTSYLNIDIKPKDSRSNFCAAGTTDCVTSFDENLTTLKVSGILWDNVWKYFGSPSQYKIEEPETAVPEHIKKGYQKIWKNLKQSEVYGEENFAKLAFWRTLVCPTGDTRKKAEIAVTALDTPTPTFDLGIPLYEPGTSRNEPIDWPGDETSSPAKGVANNRPSWSSPELIASLNSRSAHSRTIVLTEKGYIGQTPWGYAVDAKKGDVICVLLGCPVPMILRRVTVVGNRFQIVGDLYLDGIMYGEAMKALDNGKCQLEDFVLI